MAPRKKSVAKDRAEKADGSHEPLEFTREQELSALRACC
jgi:hypothetical protein